MKLPTFTLLPALGLLIDTAVSVQASVRQNGGNCEGVKSCRPRCITVRVERDVLSCGTSEGIFTVDEDVNPWDIKRFQTTNCLTTGTCVNDLCGLELDGDLTVRIGEEGHSGSSYFYSAFELEEGSDDRFTFCSIYPCTKEECSLPEQMGFELQFSFFRGSVAVEDFTATPLLSLELYLKAAFVGSRLHSNEVNRYGPIHVEWMDDPAGCGTDEFSEYAPVATLTDKLVWTSSTSIDQSLYCDGDQYLPGELPAVEPTVEPSFAPSAPPSTSISPTIKPTYSAIGEEQLAGLRIFYDATMMGSAVSTELHNWFTIPNYCSFTGVTCDENGFVIVLDLTNRRLDGELPASMEKLARLRQLKVVNNRIKGTIPDQLCTLKQLTQIELGANQFSGAIPVCLHKLRILKRLMLQYNGLTGTIPPEFCQFNQMVAFDISGNQGIYGEIPQCMGSLPLEVLRVDSVGLVGQVPPMLCASSIINGLDPNPYGCDAIACPAGKYEPSVGRTSSDETKCIDCGFPSNVIGSTSCRFMVNNTVISVTAAPSLTSAIPSFSPTASNSTSEVPTVVPKEVTSSTQPSTVPSRSPSLSPSFGTSSSPSLITSSEPSLEPSDGPSSIPSASPSASPEVVTITAIFANIGETLNAQSIEVIENTTQEYLTSKSTVIDRVSVLSQSIGGVSNETGIGSRRLDGSLAVEIEIEGKSKNGTLRDLVQSSIVDSFDNYSSFLMENIPVLIPVAPTPSPTGVQEQAEAFIDKKKGGETNWVLLGSAVALSVVAVVAVLFVRSSRQSQKEQVRAFPVEQTAAVAAASNSASAPSQEDMEDALSEESNSGWDSTSSPGEFVNDKVVQAWTAGQNDADMYLMATQKRERAERFV